MKRITKDQDLHLSQHSSNEMLSAALSVREGNILIAEFMGYVYLPDGKINGLKGILVHEDKMSMHLDVTKQFHAKYHSSWDWLMPVVDKIEETNIVIINGESCEIKTMPFSLQIKDDIEKRYHRYENYIANPQSKILAVWECVIEFIKWHNDNAVSIGSR